MICLLGNDDVRIPGITINSALPRLTNPIVASVSVPDRNRAVDDITSSALDAGMADQTVWVGSQYWPTGVRIWESRRSTDGSTGLSSQVAD